MSDIKRFTLRQLLRSPKEVLKELPVFIECRDRESFLILPKGETELSEPLELGGDTKAGWASPYTPFYEKKK